MSAARSEAWGSELEWMKGELLSVRKLFSCVLPREWALEALKTLHHLWRRMDGFVIFSCGFSVCVVRILKIF